MANSPKTFLLEVIERSTGDILIEGETRNYSLSENLCEYNRLFAAKGLFYNELQKRIRYEPKIRELLLESDWVIEGVEV